AVLGVVGGLLIATTSSDSDKWQHVWSDDFTGAAGAAPSARNWLLDTGTSYPGGAPQWGTGEIQSYTADRSNAHLDGAGHLRIVATRDASGAWHSARLESRRTDFAAPAGGALKVEARIQVPNGGAGYWPAFWMLGEKFRGVYTNWPGVGEIDIMENKGSEPSTVHGTFHCGVTPGGPCNENNGISGPDRIPSGALAAGFHSFAVEWDRTHQPEEIRWYVDGHQYFTVRSSQVDAATWSRATHHGFFILLNLAIGGSFSGPINESTRPGAAMTVDSVSVSRRDS
ncbi:MAG TPA: glycoside hydrolase family 16 protein, partial [Jatrophihabitans sp.]|nr:glycoside hydrolase family 16 protein [Jatrophihabitans sp.]